jgi:DUF1365 family protein
MSLASCLYHGVVHHHRFAPVEHAFRYRLFMLYLDLGELDEVFAGRWLWSTRRRAVAEFRRSDYPGPADRPLDESIRDLVERRTGHRPVGPVRVLTHLRYFGYGFNPVSFFYCFDRSERPVAIVADVSNTPWGERHRYVLRATANGVVDCHVGKQFHVSPFMPMDLEHRFRLTAPGERLFVRIEDRRDGEPVFSARLAMHRSEISGAALAGALLRFPWMTGQVVAAIYWQALRLYLKGAPYFEHPRPLPARGGKAHA